MTHWHIRLRDTRTGVTGITARLSSSEQGAFNRWGIIQQMQPLVVVKTADSRVLWTGGPHNTIPREITGDTVDCDSQDCQQTREAVRSFLDILNEVARTGVKVEDSQARADEIAARRTPR